MARHGLIGRQAVENHEALIAEAVCEAQSSVARAKVKLNHVRRDGVSMQRRIGELDTTIGNWESRARQQAESNREHADFPGAGDRFFAGQLRVARCYDSR